MLIFNRGFWIITYGYCEAEKVVCAYRDERFSRDVERTACATVGSRILQGDTVRFITPSEPHQNKGNPHMATRMVRELYTGSGDKVDLFNELTDREMEVLCYMAARKDHPRDCWIDRD